jgi:hypothetical protein
MLASQHAIMLSGDGVLAKRSRACRSLDETLIQYLDELGTDGRMRPLGLHAIAAIAHI